MSEAMETEAPAADEIVTAPAGDGVAEGVAQQDDGPSAEDRAMAMGWTPKTQFKGDPDKWVDAETFVKRGEEFLPFLKANNKRLEQALDRANEKMEGLQKAVAKSIEHISRADQRAYARARSELEAELHQAATNGDAESVKAITKDIVDLEREVAATPEKETPASANAEFTSWQDASPWYGKDKALSAAFDALCVEVADEGYSTPKIGLKEAERRLREQFPDKFAKPENPNRRLAGAVEGVGSPARPRGKGYSDLPTDAKEMCDDLCRTLKGYTREKYVKDYFTNEEKK